MNVARRIRMTTNVFPDVINVERMVLTLVRAAFARLRLIVVLDVKRSIGLSTRGNVRNEEDE